MHAFGKALFSSFLNGVIKETRKNNETTGEKRERVFRVIAEQDVFDFKLLAEQTGLSKGFLSKVLVQLCDKNLVVREGERFRVLNKEYLLREWALTTREVFRSLRPPKLFFFVKTRIRELFEDYVISGPFAESLVNGQTSGEGVLVYTTKLPKVDEYLSKRPNTFVFIHDEHVFYHSWKIRGWNLVSILRLCADLLAQGFTPTWLWKCSGGGWLLLEPEIFRVSFEELKRVWRGVGS
jgi:hypothetical protein